MSEKTRAWLYRIGVAAIPLLVVYGLVSESEAGLWVGLLGAVLAVGEMGMAAKHTPTRRE